MVCGLESTLTASPANRTSRIVGIGGQSSFTVAFGIGIGAPSADYRSRVKRKMRAYHAFIQAGVVAQGLLQYLAVAAHKLVWDSFGSWLRTIRPGISPSEFVVANALRQTLPEFLLAPAKTNSLTKFITDRQDTQNMRIFRLAS